MKSSSSLQKGALVLGWTEWLFLISIAGLLSFDKVYLFGT